MNSGAVQSFSKKREKKHCFLTLFWERRAKSSKIDREYMFLYIYCTTRSFRYILFWWEGSSKYN